MKLVLNNFENAILEKEFSIQRKEFHCSRLPSLKPLSSSNRMLPFNTSAAQFLSEQNGVMQSAD
jgi:hypothetical protein